MISNTNAPKGHSPQNDHGGMDRVWIGYGLREGNDRGPGLEPKWQLMISNKLDTKVPTSGGALEV